MDDKKYNGQAGRMLNVFAIINGKSSFLLSYSNNKQAFYKSLPTVLAITKSIVILCIAFNNHNSIESVNNLDIGIDPISVKSGIWKLSKISNISYDITTV